MPRPLTPPRLRIRRPPGSEQDLRELVNYLEELDAFLATAFPNMHMDAQRAIIQSGDRLDEHISDLDNPHGVTAAQVGAYPAGSKVADSERLNGQLASYYTNITARLGYTPVNQAGDTISGPLVSTAGGRCLASINPENDQAEFYFGWKDNVPRVRIGGTGPGASAPFEIHGTGDSVLLSVSQASDMTFKSNKVWHAGNDGSGSGLDADLLDGQDGSYYASKASVDAVASEVDSVSATVTSVSSALNTHKSSGDHDGRYYTKSQLNTSGGGGQVHWNNITSKPSIPSVPVPVTQLKRAQASHSPTNWRQTFAVHQYAFGSPNLSVDGRRWSHMPLRLNTSVGDEVVPILAVQDTATAQTITWDYLTASGHPRVWAEVDGRGEIVSIWEAEDPADPDFPDEPPIEVSKDDEGNPISGHLVLPLLMPDEWSISAIRDRLTAPPQSEWLTKSRFASQVDPVSILRTMYDEQLRERGLEIPDDIRSVFTDISDYDLRHWYLQLWLRQASRLLHNHRPSTMCPLYRDAFRVDRATGALIIK